ncbi:MAG: hypothetical protein ABW003_07415 [Microvirga sp.]
MRTSLKTLLAAALVFGGVAALEPTNASAQPGWGPRAPEGDTYAPRYGGRAYGYGPPDAYRGYRGGYGYRPAYYGRRYYGGSPYYGYRRGYYNGGAVAAGVVGGLALGAIAGAASNPYYYGSGRAYRPAYYAPGRCVVERRRVVNRYGRVVFQRIQTCY